MYRIVSTNYGDVIFVNGFDNQIELYSGKNLSNFEGNVNADITALSDRELIKIAERQISRRV